MLSVHIILFYHPGNFHSGTPTLFQQIQTQTFSCLLIINLYIMFYVCLVPLTSCFPQGLKFVHRGFTIRRRFPGRNPCERRGFAVLYGLSFKFWRPVRATDKRNLMQFHGFPVTLYLTFPPSLLLLRCNSITGLPAFSKQKKGRARAPDPPTAPAHVLISDPYSSKTPEGRCKFQRYPSALATEELTS